MHVQSMLIKKLISDILTLIFFILQAFSLQLKTFFFMPNACKLNIFKYVITVNCNKICQTKCVYIFQGQTGLHGHDFVF